MGVFGMTRSDAEFTADQSQCGFQHGFGGVGNPFGVTEDLSAKMPFYPFPPTAL
jgi:hypothetical protein